MSQIYSVILLGLDKNNINCSKLQIKYQVSYLDFLLLYYKIN